MVETDSGVFLIAIPSIECLSFYIEIASSERFYILKAELIKMFFLQIFNKLICLNQPCTTTIQHPTPGSSL